MQEGTLTKSEFNNDVTISPEIRRSVGATLEALTPSGRVPKETWQAAFARLSDENLIEWEGGWCPLSSERLSSLVQVVMLEADVRGEEEISGTSKSVFDRVSGLLLREATKRHVGMSKAVAGLNSEIEKITTKNDAGMWPIAELNEFESILKEEVGRFDESVIAQSTLIPPKVPAFEFNVKIEIRDQWIEGLGKMGHGLRRSVVFAMLRSHRRLRELRSSGTEGDRSEPAPLYLFLVEEPELYLHPQAERRRKRELQDLSRLSDAQVVACTHSAFFVDLSEYKGIFRLHRPNRGVTTIQGWQGTELDPLDRRALSTIYMFDSSRAAMLFADLVILVEGQSEKIVLPHLAERMGLNTNNVEIVDCGGNQGVPVYQRILEGFGIKYVAWLDTDGTTAVDIARSIRTAQNGKIVLTPGDWEKLNGLEAGRKSYVSWKHFVYEENEPNQKLQTRIRAAYTWEDYEADPMPEEVIQ